MYSDTIFTLMFTSGRSNNVKTINDVWLIIYIFKRYCIKRFAYRMFNPALTSICEGYGGHN